MKTQLAWGVLAILLGLEAGVAPGADPAQPVVTAEKIMGEWSSGVGVQDPRGYGNETWLVVLTFRPSGICRADTVEASTGKRIRVDDLPATKGNNLRLKDNNLSNVGQWRVDGSDVVVVWERWDESSNRPTHGRFATGLRS
jgi:hypothetical protein